jgi:hypothetical protein
MSTGRTLHSARTPYPVRVVLHYANAKPTRRTWRRTAVGPFARYVPVPPDGSVFGVESYEELDAHLSEFRGVLGRWIELSRKDRGERRQLLGIVGERARLRIVRWVSRGDGTIAEVFDTDTNSFSEMLYSYLALALRTVPVSRLRRCAVCPRIFFYPSRRRALYCSERCRMRTMMRRYRARLRSVGTCRRTEHR